MQHLWEFPGGKINAGESADAALCRELVEELGIVVREFAHLQTLQHDYPDLRVNIEFFIVSAWDGTPAGMEGQQLRWVSEDKLDTRMLLPADAPIVDMLATRRKTGG